MVDWFVRSVLRAWSRVCIVNDMNISKKAWIAGAVLGVAVIAIGVSVGTSGDDNSSSTPTTVAAAPETPVAATRAATAPTTRATTRSNAPTTKSQRQAISAVETYLHVGGGFSREGMIDQLTSSYGSGFSHADAVFAVDYVNPDWNQQAVEAAESYMNLGTGMSRQALMEQLTSSYGSQFTQEQAEYAVNKVY